MINPAYRLSDLPYVHHLPGRNVLSIGSYLKLQRQYCLLIRKTYHTVYCWPDELNVILCNSWLSRSVDTTLGIQIVKYMTRDIACVLRLRGIEYRIVGRYDILNQSWPESARQSIHDLCEYDWL